MRTRTALRTAGAGLAAAVLAGTLASVPATAAPQGAPNVPSDSSSTADFRVLPYLMEPTTTSMDLVWFTESDEPGTVTVSGPGLGNGHKGKGRSRRLTSAPEHQPLLDYTEAELTEEIEGLPQGSWLKGPHNYKHRVGITGLKPGKEYTYTVRQGDSSHTATFSTAPTQKSWDHIRIAAFSDSETEPRGRVERREWEQSMVNPYTDGSETRPEAGSAWDVLFGSTTRYGQPTLRYPLTQDQAFRENLEAIAESDPDLVMIAGDLTQGAGYQPAWDEFFGYVAGEHGDLASRVPLLTALGNWETFASINGGYGPADNPVPAVISRNKYHAYLERHGEGTDQENPQFRGSYYRTDHGPLTVLTLDSTNGVPDEDTRTGDVKPLFSGDDMRLTEQNLSTDTQGSFTQAGYEKAFQSVFPGTTAADADLPVFNPGHAQWAWAEEQLAQARAEGRIVLVQFHHAPYSVGVHGTPPNHEHADNQSGVAMRAYTPLFEEHGVAAVISGHDEMFQRSWVDTDGDGRGFHAYDVGVAADGLRGEQYAQDEDGNWQPIRFNTHMEWTANTHEPETWETVDGVRQLVDGGLHYGHLQIDIERRGRGAEITLSPVYLFPVLDEDYELVRTERRVYDDVQTISIGKDGRPAPRR